MKSTREISRLVGTSPRNVLKIAARLGLRPSKFGKANVWTPSQVRRIQQSRTDRRKAEIKAALVGGVK